MYISTMMWILVIVFTLCSNIFIHDGTYNTFHSSFDTGSIKPDVCAVITLSIVNMGIMNSLYIVLGPLLGSEKRFH